MAGKMDQKTIIVLAVVGSVGVLSAILGFSAEGTKNTYATSHSRYYGCYYPPTPALGLGVCAAIFLIIAQVIFAVVGGCCGCCKSRALPSVTNRIIGVVCAVVSWIAAVIAFGLFVGGANASVEGWQDTGPYGLCYVLSDGIFAGGGVLALAATALGLASYVLLCRNPIAAAAPSTEGGEQPPATAAAPNTGGGQQLPAAAAGIPTVQPRFPQQPPPQASAQAPPPRFLQQTHPQVYGQAPPPKFLQKPRPPTIPPKYPQPSAPPHGQGKAEHVYEVELQVDDPQLEYQNGSGLADLHEGEAQTSGGKHYVSELPKGEAEAYGGKYSLHSPE